MNWNKFLICSLWLLWLLCDFLKCMPDDTGVIVAQPIELTPDQARDVIRLHMEKLNEKWKSKWGKEVPAFGSEMKAKLFSNLDQNATLLNHGSYGASPDYILESEMEWRSNMQRNPDRYLQIIARSLVKETASAIARYLNAPNEDDVVIVENASTAVNAVIRSLSFKKEETILFLNFEYGMTKNTIYYAREKYGVNLVEVAIPFPLEDESVIIERVQSALNQVKNLRLAVFDHIVSSPAMILPIKKLISIVHQKGANVLIDGAHSLGHLPIDLKDLDVDYFLSNGHKWLCTPKSAAFLYVKKSLQQGIHPTVISHWFNKGFFEEFSWTGTKDFSSLFTFHAGFEFRKLIGGDEKIMEHNNELCKWAVEALSSKWQVEKPLPLHMVAATANVQLPCSKFAGANCYDWDMQQVKMKLIREYNMWVSIDLHFFQ